MSALEKFQEEIGRLRADAVKDSMQRAGFSEKLDTKVPPPKAKKADIATYGKGHSREKSEDAKSGAPVKSKKADKPPVAAAVTQSAEGDAGTTAEPAPSLQPAGGSDSGLDIELEIQVC